MTSVINDRNLKKSINTEISYSTRGKIANASITKKNKEHIKYSKIPFKVVSTFCRTVLTSTTKSFQVLLPVEPSIPSGHIV